MGYKRGWPNVSARIRFGPSRRSPETAKDGRELFEERGHGAFTLHSFLYRQFLSLEGGRGFDLTEKGRGALASVPEHKLGKPNPRKHKRRP